MTTQVETNSTQTESTTPCYSVLFLSFVHSFIQSDSHSDVFLLFAPTTLLLSMPVLLS